MERIDNVKFYQDGCMDSMGLRILKSESLITDDTYIELRMDLLALMPEPREYTEEEK